MFPIKDGWKIQTNDELQVMYRKQNIVNNYKSTKTRLGRSSGKNVWW
jgi:hypothetical protein